MRPCDIRDDGPGYRSAHPGYEEAVLGSPPLRCYKPGGEQMPDLAMRHRPKLLMAITALSLLASPAAAQSLTDRFKSMFGGGKSEPAASDPAVPAAGVSDLTCPPVNIRSGASTFTVGMPGKPAAGADLRFQATITRTARDCTLNAGQILARIGIQGRVIAGPAGSPPIVDVPLRIAVVQEGITPKTIATKAYRTSVNMGGDTSVPFSYVVEDLVYPAPAGGDADSLVFYIGFDPQALGPAPKAAKKNK